MGSGKGYRELPANAYSAKLGIVADGRRSNNQGVTRCTATFTPPAVTANLRWMAHMPLGNSLPGRVATPANGPGTFFRASGPHWRIYFGDIYAI